VDNNILLPGIPTGHIIIYIVNQLPARRRVYSRFSKSFNFFENIPFIYYDFKTTHQYKKNFKFLRCWMTAHVFYFTFRSRILFGKFQYVKIKFRRSIVHSVAAAIPFSRCIRRYSTHLIIGWLVMDHGGYSDQWA